MPIGRAAVETVELPLNPRQQATKCRFESGLAHQFRPRAEDREETKDEERTEK